MKKLVYVLCILFLIVGCINRRQPKTDKQKDSIVMVYGFGNLPIDSGVKMPFKDLFAYKDSFMPIYDEVTKAIVYMRSKCGCKFGDWYVNSEGDTLFCVEDGYAKYVSAEEWHNYYEHFKE